MCYHNLVMINKVIDSYKHNLFIIILGPFLKIIEAAFDLMIPLFMKAIIDLNQYHSPNAIPNSLSAFFASAIRFFNPSDTAISDALTGGILILVMGIVGFAITMVSQYLAAVASVNVGSEVRTSLFSKILKLSKKERDNISQSRLLTLINSDSYQLQKGMLFFVRLAVRAPFILIGSLIISLVLDWRVGLTYVVIVPLLFFVSFMILRKTSIGYVDVQTNLDDISKQTSETIEGARVIRASNNQENAYNSFSEKTTLYQDKLLKINKLNALVNPLTFAITSIVLVVIILLLQDDLFSTNGSQITSMIIAEMSYLAQIFFVVTQLSLVIPEMVKAGVSRKRIDGVLLINPSIADGVNQTLTNNQEPVIRFDHVSFSFNDDGKYFLNDLNFQIRKGETFAIIGGTGSGKSTIINLIERFYDCSKGDVYYKGVNLKECDLSSLRSQIGLVNQRSSLFKGTIKDNYLMSNPLASDEDIINALKDAQAYEFVKEYSDSINHQVNEGGTNFSGGQKQRLCIGRALVKKPQLLILDDATSALDLLTDKKIREHLASLKDITKIIVSQRVATIQNADYILVIDAGKVVGQGKHSDLLISCPIYQEIYQSQIKREQYDK